MVKVKTRVASTPSPPSEEASYDFHEDFNDPSAKLILLSSDKKAFRVHVYMLQAASRVWADQLSDAHHSENGKRPPIPIDDPDYGTADSVHFWLSALYGRAFPTPTLAAWDALWDALDLAKKYECGVARRSLLLEARQYVPTAGEQWESVEPKDLFLLGARHDDIGLASSAIEAGESFAWNPCEKGLDVKAPCFDLSAWPLDEFALLDHRHALALLRATRSVTATREAERWKIGDGAKVAAEYVRWVKKLS